MLTTPGMSTPMPSVKLSLGKFVVVRPRADGTARVMFEVPPRLRPSGWLPTIPLPIEGERQGDLKDAAEVARIKADAGKLYDRYLDAKAGRPTGPAARSIATLIAEWQGSEAYRKTKPKTQEGYDWLAKRVQAWADALPRQPDPVTMLRKDVERFLKLFDDRPTLKWHLRKVLRLIMDQAVALGWRTDNPVDGVKIGMPESRVTIWEQGDVDLYVAAAEAAGQRWLGGLILTEWEIGQRLTDCILFTRSLKADQAGYSAAEGVFRFWQSKTGEYVTIPVSDRLRAALGHLKVEGSPYLFFDAATGRPFPDVGRLGHVFEEVRERALKAGGRRLVLRALRHSCVVQLARAGCTVAEIASITGHSIGTVESILSTYLPRDNVVAWNAQRKRGLIGEQQ